MDIKVQANWTFVSILTPGFVFNVKAMFDEVTMVNGVFTQGRNQGNDKVTMFRVLYTEDGTTWKTVNEQDTGVEQVNVAANVFLQKKYSWTDIKLKQKHTFY